MNILIADKFSEFHKEILEGEGHTCTVNVDLNGDNLHEHIAGFDVLIVRSTVVNAQALDAATDLKLVIRAGAGTNTIDKAHARSKGIDVCNVPGANAIAVAELAMGLILSIDRNIPDNVADLRAGVWNKKKYSKAVGLYGRSLGIIGLGSIGLSLAVRAIAFGMEVFIVKKEGRSKETEARIESMRVHQLASQDEVIRECDIISVHLPSTPETKGSVNESFLNKMKDGAILINTSRGDVVNEADLIKAMDDKGIRAGLDVYANEPGAGDSTFDSALAKHPNVYGTHHIGASTEQAQTAVADGVIRVLKSYEADELIYCVNS